MNTLYKVNILWPKNVFPETRCISLQCLIDHCDCFQKCWTFEKYGNYFKNSSNAPSNLLCNVLNLIFYSLRQFFDILSNDIALKGFLLQHCVVFFILYIAYLRYWFLNCFLRGLIFGLILLLSDRKSLRLDIFDLKRNWNKNN